MGWPRGGKATPNYAWADYMIAFDDRKPSGVSITYRIGDESLNGSYVEQY